MKDEQEPIARVTGVHGGRFIVEPLNPAMVLPTDMALYADPQPKAEQELDSDGLNAAYVIGVQDGKKMREWVGLTDEDKQIAFDDTQEGGGFWEFADAIEAKLKEKNT